MSAALVRRQSEAIGVSYSTDQLQLIKDIYAKGASDAEFRLFVEVSKYQKLDIFKKQIYLMKFWDTDKGGWGFQPVTGIDGYRTKAEDTGLYGGQLGPFWCGEDGVWKDVWTSNRPPAAAKVGIIRTDWQEPCWAVARYASYVQTKKDGTPTKMWDKMPDNQLAKCAESLGLRKAFPQQVSGLYTDIEMEQAGEPIERNVTRAYPGLEAVTDAEQKARAELRANLQAAWPQDKMEHFDSWFAAIAEGATAEEVKGMFKGMTIRDIKAKLKKAADHPVGTVIIDAEPLPPINLASDRDSLLTDIDAQQERLQKLGLAPEQVSKLVLAHTAGEAPADLDYEGLRALNEALASEIADFTPSVKIGA